MSLHPNANVFVRAILADPADATTRLAFADWLDETGDPANLAWSQFIRLMAEADQQPPDSPERKELERRAAELTAAITATLTLDAAQLVGHVEHLWQLLPRQSIAVRLAGYQLTREVVEFIPESVARENLVLPLQLDGQNLRIATAEPADYHTLQKLQFILNKDIAAVRAGADEIRAAIRHCYGMHETECVDSVLIEFVDTAIEFAARTDDPEAIPDYPFATEADIPVVRLVNLILAEAIRMGADGIRFAPGPDAVAVSFRIGGEWRERDHIPLRLWSAMTTRIAVMTGIPIDALSGQRSPITGQIPLRLANTNYDLRVTSRPATGGILIEIDNPADASSERQ